MTLEEALNEYDSLDSRKAQEDFLFNLYQGGDASNFGLVTDLLQALQDRKGPAKVDESLAGTKADTNRREQGRKATKGGLNENPDVITGRESRFIGSNPDGWYAFKVSKEGTPQSFMARIENGIFKGYTASNNKTQSDLDKIRKDYKDDEKEIFFQTKSADTDRDPVFQKEITAQEGTPEYNQQLEEAKQDFMNSQEAITNKQEGKLKGKQEKIRQSSDDLKLKLFDGKNIFDMLTEFQKKNAKGFAKSKLFTWLQDKGATIAKDGTIYSVTAVPDGTDVFNKLSPEEINDIKEIKLKTKHDAYRTSKKAKQNEDGTFTYTFKPDNKVITTGKGGVISETNFRSRGNIKQGVSSYAEAKEKGIVPETKNLSRSNAGNVDWTDTEKTKEQEKRQLEDYLRKDNVKPTPSLVDILKRGL